jgi:hypothetical protein
VSVVYGKPCGLLGGVREEDAETELHVWKVNQSITKYEACMIVCYQK